MITNIHTTLPPVIYENKDVFVFNKPAGLLVHGDGRSHGTTLADMLAEKYPVMKDVGEPSHVVDRDGNILTIYRPGIVHRLDKDTTGALVVARNQKAFEFLKKQFQERTVEKKYLALVHGSVKNDSGTINRPIARSTSDFRRWSATRGTRGEKRDAVTNYKVLKRFSLGEHPVTLLLVSPKTGRTHQIRVHMKAINYPLVGDILYAGTKRPDLGFSRPALHASSVSFDLPDGNRVSIEAPIPDDLREAVAGGQKMC